MNPATFRFSTDILRRLGEELITSFDQGIVELVKNAYDADAVRCTVELVDTDRPGGTVVISDDGDGMSNDDIHDGWLVVGRSRKVPSSRTRLNRLPAGSKGLGRLGAIRMGDEVVLVTRPHSEPGAEYSVHIRWPDFAERSVVEDVELSVRRSSTGLGSGSRIEIRRLRERLGLREVRRLARELLLMADPFGDPSGFTPKLVAPEFVKMEQLVSKAYFDDCEFRMSAQLSDQGLASVEVRDRSEDIRWASEREDFDSCYRAPKTTFELWAFLLRSASFADRDSTVGEVRRWLSQIGGVHLYHRGLRVRPYGDVGHDWLDMNLARARDPELRPSTNTSVGRVAVLDEEQYLVQKTDRSGFIEDEAFRELRRFAVDALEWMQTKRLAERERRRSERRAKSSERAKKAGANLRRVIDKLPPQDAAVVNKAANDYVSARTVEHDQLRDEIALYQTVASVGTAVSVFAHEIEAPAADLSVSIRAVERRARASLDCRYESNLGQQIESVKGSADLIARFATLPLNLLKRGKRRRTVLDINETVRQTVVLFDPYLRDARVETSLELSDSSIHINGSVAAIEAIVSNLITNSVKAFKRGSGLLAPRKLVFRTAIADNRAVVSVLDSGPGIETRLAESIWLPGVTCDEGGTGLGLTIVRDTVADLGGQAKAINNSDLGGAEFVIEIPCISRIT